MVHACQRFAKYSPNHTLFVILCSCNPRDVIFSEKIFLRYCFCHVVAFRIHVVYNKHNAILLLFTLQRTLLYANLHFNGLTIGIILNSNRSCKTTWQPRLIFYHIEIRLRLKMKPVFERHLTWTPPSCLGYLHRWLNFAWLLSLWRLGGKM